MTTIFQAPSSSPAAETADETPASAGASSPSLDDVVSAVVSRRTELLWSGSWRAEFERRTETCLVPSGYYYPVPTTAEVDKSFEYTEEAPFLIPGVFDPVLLQATLSELIGFAADFHPPTEGDTENPQGYFWNLGPFSYCDALTYYALIRSRRPQHILEIGSGASTWVALEALRRNGSGTITCIEPYPKQYLKERSDIHLIEKKMEDLDQEFFSENLKDGDFLFVDSTHTVKSGSDCVHFYLRILPQIRKNILVHVHDVFLPKPIPKEWILGHHIYWAEQYLLLAFLTNNPRTKVIYGSEAGMMFCSKLMAEMAAGRTQPGGSSFWFTLADA